MRKIFLWLVFFYFLLLVEVSFLRKVYFFPNIVILGVILFPVIFKVQKKEVFWIGFWGGFFLDFFSSLFFGFYTFFCVFLAFLSFNVSSFLKIK